MSNPTATLLILLGFIVGIVFGLAAGVTIAEKHRKALYYDALSMTYLAEHAIDEVEQAALSIPDQERRSHVLRSSEKRREIFRHLQQALEARRP